LVEFVLPLLVK